MTSGVGQTPAPTRRPQRLPLTGAQPVRPGRTSVGAWATPALTPGQAAVLGIGRAAPRPVADESQPQGWTVRRVLPISLTYDHRIVNGLPAGRFLDDLAQLLEHPDEALSG